jgi:hypothetical protein
MLNGKWKMLSEAKSRHRHTGQAEREKMLSPDEIETKYRRDEIIVVF